MKLHNLKQSDKMFVKKKESRAEPNKALSNKSILKLILYLIILIILWLLPDVFNSEYLYFLWFLSAGVISVFLIIRYKSVKKQDVIIAVILGVIASISNPFWGITAIFAYLGGQSVFRKCNNKIKVIKGTSKKEIAVTVLGTLIAGAVLGTVNLLFMGMGTAANPGFELQFLFLAFRAGVTEEIIFSFLLFAVCVHITKGQALSKGENILCYIIMSLPHALTHFSLHNLNIVMLLGLFIFGIIFVLLQRKRDLSTAMGSHFIVDFMRFLIFST